HVASDYIPVIASVGADSEGQSYNVNADEAAGAVARALRAYKAIFLTDVAGWLRDVSDPESLVGEATASEVTAAPGGVTGGMRLAERLSRSSLGGRVFFSNSGAEANEAALKLVRKHRRGGDIVVVSGGFHGRTYGALSATPQEAKQAPFAPLVPGFVVVPRDDPAALDAAVTDRTAAVLLEPVQGESGIWPLPDAMLRTARAACDRVGAALV